MPEPHSDTKETVQRQSAPPVILASGSPRRIELLGGLGVPFEFTISGADETLAPGLDAEEQAMALAERKARAVAGALPAGLVLGADTLVVLDGVVLGKPVDDDEASSFLRRLSGGTHRVVTGLALIDAATGACRCGAVSTQVRMTDLIEPEIAAYVATGEPRDKAGAYAIQGHGAALISGIEGCYTNVVGLPLCEVARLLAEAGTGIPEAWAGCRDADGKNCPRVV